MADDNWSWFTAQLRPYLNSNDGPILVMLKRKYLATSCAFRRNGGARSVLMHCLQRIQSCPSRTYVTLVDLKRKLKENTSSSAQTEEVLKPLTRNTSQQLMISTSPLLANSRPTTPEASIEVDHKPPAPPLGRPGRQTLLPFGLPNSVKSVKTAKSELSPRLLPSDDEATKFPHSPIKSKRRIPLSAVSIEAPKKTPRVASVESQREEENIMVDLDSPSTVEPRTRRLPSPSSQKADRRKLYHLERRMELLSSQIRELEAAEMDLSDLESEESAYLRLDDLKRQHLSVWKQLCRLRHISRHAASLSRCGFRYEGSRYPAINRAVETRVNSSRDFPDYADIYKLVVETSEKENLGLSSAVIKSQARDIFTDIGHRLKDRRQREFRRDFGCHLTDEQGISDDPATSCPELRRRLQENTRIATHNLNLVLTKYSRLQDDLVERVTSTSSDRLDDSNQASVKSGEDAIEVATSDEDDGDSIIERSSIPLPTTHLDAHIISPYFTERQSLASASTSASLDSPSKSQPLDRLASPPPRDSSTPANDMSPPPSVAEVGNSAVDDQPETASSADNAAAETAEAGDAPEVITISDDDEPEVVSCEWNPSPRHLSAFHSVPGSSITNKTVTQKASKVPGGGYVISTSEEQSVVSVVPQPNAMGSATTRVVQQRREQQFYIPPSFNPFYLHRF